MTAPASADRGQWSSQIGFILAAAGSAIGLGNIWRCGWLLGELGGAPMTNNVRVLAALGHTAVAIGRVAHGAGVCSERRIYRNPEHDHE